MPTPTISDAELLARCIEVFRTYGFEGATVSRLTKATGLERGSLYHRFPAGKEGIAMAVAKAVDAWVKAQVVDVLAGSEPARERIQAVCDALSSFYVGGTKWCVLDLLSVPGADASVTMVLRSATQAWIDAFALFVQEAGHEEPVARRRAIDALVQIEGSLVLSRVLDDPSAFQRVIRELPGYLCAE